MRPKLRSGEGKSLALLLVQFIRINIKTMAEKQKTLNNTLYILSITMEAISLKLDENMLENIDENLKKHNYSTRTEFIRTAIRDKLEDLSRSELIKEFMKFKGKAPRKTTDKERAKIREQAVLDMAKEKGWDV